MSVRESSGPQAVLVNGVFGSGKSSVAAEMADLLEKRHRHYALLDLDYFAWGFAGSYDERAEHEMMLRNLRAVVPNFRVAGVRYFVLARFIRDLYELESLRAELGMPLLMVRLDVPFFEIQQRLASDPTSGRQDDLRDAASSLASWDVAGLEDLAVSNDRPVSTVASEILNWLAW